MQTEEVTIVDEDSKPYARSVPQVFGEYLPNIKAISFVDAQWNGRNPLHASFFDCLSRWGSVTKIELTTCTFRTLSDFERLVYELPKLTRLTGIELGIGTLSLEPV